MINYSIAVYFAYKFGIIRPTATNLLFICWLSIGRKIFWVAGSSQLPTPYSIQALKNLTLHLNQIFISLILLQITRKKQCALYSRTDRLTIFSGNQHINMKLNRMMPEEREALE